MVSLKYNTHIPYEVLHDMYHLRLKIQQLHMPVKCDHLTSSMGFVAVISKALTCRVEPTQLNLAS